MIYIDKIVNFIIRPTRDQYYVKRLGDPQITVQTSTGEHIKAIREDRVILNKHNEHIHLSYYAIQQNDRHNIQQQAYSFNPNSKTYYSNFHSKNTQLSSHYASRYKVKDFLNKCVIYLHANNGSRIQGMAYLQKLIQAQCNVCLFDCSGSGLSEGEYVTLGLKQARDLDCVVNFLVRQKKITQIILWGRSMGAATAIIYGSKHSKVKVSGMVLDSPFKDLQKLIVQIASDKTGLPKMFFQPLIPFIRSEILNKTGYNIDELKLKKYIERDTRGNQSSSSRKSIDDKLTDRKDLSKNKYNPRDKLSNIPALFIVSKKDKFVHYNHCEKLFKRYRCEDKEIMYIETQHHEARNERDVDQIISFIVDHLNANDEDQYQVNLSPLKFTKNVPARSRLDSSKMILKDQSFQVLSPQKKTSLSPKFVINSHNSFNGSQKKTQKYSFHTKTLTSKNVNLNSNESSHQHLGYRPKKAPYYVKSPFSKNHMATQSISFHEISDIPIPNQNLSQNESSFDLNSTQIMRSLQEFKDLKHNNSHQSLLSKGQRNELSRMTCYSGNSNQNNNKINKFNITSQQTKTPPHYLSKTSLTQKNRGKISLSSMLAYQQNTTKYNTSFDFHKPASKQYNSSNPYLNEDYYEQASRYESIKVSSYTDKKIDQQPYLSLSKAQQISQSYPYSISEKTLFTKHDQKPQHFKNKKENHTISLKTSIMNMIEPNKSNYFLENHYGTKKVSTHNRIVE